MARYAIIEVATGIVTNVVMWDGDEGWAPDEGFIAIESTTAGPGWTYANGVFSAPPVAPPTDEEIIASNTAYLLQYTQLASAQKTALTNRVGTLLDAVELKMATPEEEAELPVRQAQLLDWKRYAIYLGRVTSQSGWALVVVWPVQPAEGMDLTVSAVAKVVQAS